jgi:ferredoxin
MATADEYERVTMPTITIDGVTSDVAAGTRLVNAIEDAGIEIGHRCGGNARCTTCRVVFASGEPDTMTAAEHAKLSERGLLGSHRLSCQIECHHDMQLSSVMTRTNQDWTDTGPRCADAVTPEAVFLPRASLGA